MFIGLLFQFSFISEINKIIKDLTEETRRRPGKKGKGRNREKYTQQGARYVVDIGAVFKPGVAAIALLLKSELGIETDKLKTLKPRPKFKPGGGRIIYTCSKQSFAYTAEEQSLKIGLNT